MRLIYPVPAGTGQPDLAALYAYPDRAPSPGGTGDPGGADGPVCAGRPWVRASMIESADGAAAVDGLSGGLGGSADHEVFGLLRALAGVILVGAGTARAEAYRPARVAPRWAALRAGRPGAPPIAVLSARLDLDPEGPLLAGAGGVRTIVITSESAAADRRAKIARRADVIIGGEHKVSAAAAVSALAGRGYREILAEGGPHLLGQLAETGLIDELCVTISPVLAGGRAGRIVQGRGSPPASRLDLAHVLADDDGYLLCRYVSRAGG